MSQIEKIYDNWINEQPYSYELDEAYSKVFDNIKSVAGSLKVDVFNEIYCMVLDCISIGQHEAFLAGFKTAAALWREC